MAKVKGGAYCRIGYSTRVEFEIPDELAARIKVAAAKNDGSLNGSDPEYDEIIEAVHKAMPEIDLKGGQYDKGNFEYDDFEIDGNVVRF